MKTTPPSDVTAAVGTEILFENDRVRVWEMLLAPGESSPLHRHVHDHLLLYAEPAEIRATFEGRPVIQHVEHGCVAYRAVGSGLPPHSITNVAGTPSRHFIIELLGPSASDQPTALEHNGRARTEELAADPK